MKDGYLLLIGKDDGTLLVDCCEERKQQLEAEYKEDVRILAIVEGSLIPIPHCNLGCLKNKKKG